MHKRESGFEEIQKTNMIVIDEKKGRGRVRS